MMKNHYIHMGCILLGILLFPLDALAWGPMAHLDFALQILSGSMVIGPSILSLLQKHSGDFLWGTLAADVIIGKNRAKNHDHCHNWDVARHLLLEAKKESPARVAFALGYIHHLGADVVAHNHIIPQMLIIHYQAKGVGHLYWEVRADQRLLKQNPSIQTAWQDLAKQRFPSHDKFLKKHLVPTIFPNRLSASIYMKNLHMQQKASWRRAIGTIDTKSKLLFSQRDLLLWRNLATHSGARAIDNPHNKSFDAIDPVGAEALRNALVHRKALRRELQKHGKSAHLEEMYQQALIQARTVDISLFE